MKKRAKKTPRRTKKIRLNKKLRVVLWIFVLGLAAYDFISGYISSRHQEEITVEAGKINTLKSMAQLCSVEIYNEASVLDTVNNKVMFAIQRQRGSISFDLEKLRADTVGDTVRLTLPPEIISIYESTEPNSWEVIDTKAVGPMSILRNGKFTVEEENAVKARFKKKSMKMLYTNGTVRRARAEAAKTLQGLMESVYRQPVVVDDPTPGGTYRPNRASVKVS